MQDLGYCMRAHIIKDGVIANTIEVELLGAIPGLVDASVGGSIDDSIVNGVVVPKPAPPFDPAPVMAELDAIDRKSIRSIREWIAAQPNAPQLLKDRDAQAAAARGKLK